MAEDQRSGPVRVVVHPEATPALGADLLAIPGIELIRPTHDAGVAQALASARVLLTFRWNDAFLQPGLSFVQSLSAGYNQYPVETFRERGIVLSNTSGLQPVVAEHAIALLLASLRSLREAVDDMRDRSWNLHVQVDDGGVPTYRLSDANELGGRTVVVLGLGGIGEAIAQRLAGWDVHLIGVTRRPDAYAGRVADVRPLAALEAACAEASVLMVALPLLPETRGIVSERVLDALAGGWVVNVSRGPLVDEPALVARLRDGRLSGAGPDVADVEPLPPEAEIWSLPNLVLTPHIGGLTPGFPARLAALFAANLDAFRSGAGWRNRVC